MSVCIQFEKARRLTDLIFQRIIRKLSISQAATFPSSMKRTRSKGQTKSKDDEDKSKTSQTELKNPEEKSINLKKLKEWKNLTNIELKKPNEGSEKTKVRAVVDLEMMREELKQLEDPPTTISEKVSCSARLPYSFFDVPCENLAKNLLGKILVRRLENGTILKGKIVETEGYLGVVDKASHSYQNKVTSRNIPMYMPPGTIYVYMTYGMYYCFNISSQEKGAFVLVNAVEPLIGLSYMELLRNMQLKSNKKEKTIVENVKQYRSHELCNDPFKICSAFAIEEDEFNRKNLAVCPSLWLEDDEQTKFLTIVEAHCVSNEVCTKKLKRYYILGNACVSQKDIESEEKAVTVIIGDGCAVLVRAVEPVEGIEHMTNHRNLKARVKSVETKKTQKSVKPHELCNGPSKLCMAYELHKSHSKYSMCSWKGLWLEDNTTEEHIKIVCCSRIGIDSCGPEWAQKPLRYYIHGNKFVSRRDKKAENLLNTDSALDHPIIQ